MLNTVFYLPLVLWLIKAPYGPRFRKGTPPPRRAVRGLADIVNTIRDVRQLPVIASMTVLAGAASFFTAAQRNLSTPVRKVRRKVSSVEGELTMHDGTVQVIDRVVLLAPSERALRVLSWGMIALAVAFALARRGY